MCSGIVESYVVLFQEVLLDCRVSDCSIGVCFGEGNIRCVLSIRGDDYGAHLTFGSFVLFVFATVVRQIVRLNSDGTEEFRNLFMTLFAKWWVTSTDLAHHFNKGS